MRPLGILAMATIAALGLVLPSDAIAQQTSLKEQLVGTWSYVSSTAKLPDGSPLWGDQSKGPLHPDRQRPLFLAGLSL
jgi:hypothetical protein